MINPNDTNAKYYNIIYSHIKGMELTNKECSLISSILNSPKGKILDVGCGTGRHSLELLNMGYDVTMLDSSKGMLQEIKSEKDIIVLHGDIFKYKTKNKFDLIILMWNTFNEIALTSERAETLFIKLKSLLSEKGGILINTENVESFPFKPEFSIKKNIDGIDYSVDWKIKFINKIGNITKSIEHIKVGSEFDNQAFITQRWWKFDELSDLAEKSAMKINKYNINGVNESYLVFTKII